MSVIEEVSKVDVALYALYKLGGVSKKIHTEYIAFKAYTLSEERFCWTLPEFRKRGYPDKTTVRYALETAKKQKLVIGRAGKDVGGSTSEGWQFTPAGVKWFLTNEQRIKEGLKSEEPLSSVLPTLQAKRFIKKIRSERIFVLYRAKKSLSEATFYDFADMLNCSPDANRKVIQQKFDLLKSTAITINDKELNEFLSNCESKFADVLMP